MSHSGDDDGFDHVDGVCKDVDWEAVHSLRPRYGMYIPHQPVGLSCPPEEDMTRQEFAEDADINVLMKRYEVTGVMPQRDTSAAFYGDFVDLPTFMEAQHAIMEAEAAFAALPARVRREFDNDPREFVKFASDPDNVKQMREWGLAEPEKAPDKPLDPPKGVEPAKPANEPATSAGS